jgi:hypothetical protein
MWGLLALFGANAACLAGGEPVVFHAQLIRGTDQVQPPERTWRPVGPKLSQKLCPKFRWKFYWEVNRQTLSVPSGKATRIRLSPEREIEIDLSAGSESEIRLYTRGRQVRKSRQSLQANMTIMGGGWEEKDCWFIVVRRDKPSVD